MKPNILFILSDDHGAWAMHCAGNDDIITPNLDALAENGVRYDNFFCASPVCSPARASIVTGEMPSCHGVHDWLCAGNADTEKYPNMKEHPHFKNPDKGIEYLENHPSYIDYLQRGGYTCALSGKWHLGRNDHPKKGFDRWFSIEAGGCNYYDPDVFENGQYSRPRRYITDLITEKAMEYLGDFKGQDKPFYLSVHYTAPHSPWSFDNHPKEYIDMYKDCEFKATPDLPIHPKQVGIGLVGDTPEKRRKHLNGYYAAITAMDNGIGRIVKALKENGQYENTLIIFTADNGMNLGQHGLWGKGNATYPPNMYDSSVKVPFIACAPFMKRRGYVNTNFHSACDIFFTLLEAGECEYDSNSYQRGQSFYREIVSGDSKEQDEEIAVCDEYGMVRMLRDKHYKLIKHYKDGSEILYDMVKDPEEKCDLSDLPEYDGVRDDMRKRLEERFKELENKLCSGKQYDVIGRGQRDLCWKEQPFVTTYEYYSDSKKRINKAKNKE